MVLAADRRIRIAGINYKDQPDNARRFLGRYGNPFVANGADANGRAAIEWGVYGVPETFVVGRDGRIAYKLIGPITPDNLDKRAQARDREGAGSAGSRIASSQWRTGRVGKGARARKQLLDAHSIPCAVPRGHGGGFIRVGTALLTICAGDENLFAPLPHPDRLSAGFLRLRRGIFRAAADTAAPRTRRSAATRRTP